MRNQKVADWKALCFSLLCSLSFSLLLSANFPSFPGINLHGFSSENPKITPFVEFFVFSFYQVWITSPWPLFVGVCCNVFHGFYAFCSWFWLFVVLMFCFGIYGWFWVGEECFWRCCCWLGVCDVWCFCVFCFIFIFIFCFVVWWIGMWIENLVDFFFWFFYWGLIEFEIFFLVLELVGLSWLKIGGGSNSHGWWNDWFWLSVVEFVLEVMEQCCALWVSLIVWWWSAFFSESSMNVLWCLDLLCWHSLKLILIWFFFFLFWNCEFFMRLIVTIQEKDALVNYLKLQRNWDI